MRSQTTRQIPARSEKINCVIHKIYLDDII